MKRFLIASLFCTPALAAPPPNADLTLAPFYRSLTLPGQYNGYCCNNSDCRPVEAELRNGTWWALASKEVFGENAPDKYVEVDPNHIIREEDLKPGKRPITAAGCWYNNEWRCFLKPPQSF